MNKGLWHSSTGLKEVAVRLLPEGASLDEEVTFLQEAVINGQFSDHPNIVHLYGMATLRNPVIMHAWKQTKNNHFLNECIVYVPGRTRIDTNCYGVLGK